MTGCIIEDPPPYTQPKKTPARLNLREAAPLIDGIIVRPIGGSVDFDVPVVSEDAGDTLIAFLLLNYQGGDLQEVESDELPPATADVERSIEMRWNVTNINPGCHRLTLFVTHFSNLAFGSPEPVKDSSDVAVAVWWANIAPTADSANTLVNCPLATVGGP